MSAALRCSWLGGLSEVAHEVAHASCMHGDSRGQPGYRTRTRTLTRSEGTVPMYRTLVRSEGSTQPAAGGGDHFIGALSTTTTPTPVTTATLCPAAVAVARGNPARHWRCVRRPLPLLLLLVCGCEAAAVRRL